MSLGADEIGQRGAAAIMAALGASQDNSARSQQRVLGMSQLGGCREFIRATVSGDPHTPEVGLKWAAFLGTAIGDYIETILKAGNEAIITQKRLTLVLKSGIRVSGSADLIYPDSIWDIKTKDTLSWVRRDGPTFAQKAQISGYLVAAVQDGTLADTATGHLIFMDRSGKDKTPHVWSLSYEQALATMEIVEERLDDVSRALSSGAMATRDEPESYCFAIQCPFYSSCWAGYMPTGTLDHPRILDAVEKYKAGRDEMKAAKGLMEEARVEMRGDPDRSHELVSGVTPDGTSVQFTLVSGRNGDFEKLDVREKKTTKSQKETP